MGDRTLHLEPVLGSGVAACGRRLTSVGESTGMAEFVTCADCKRRNRRATAGGPRLPVEGDVALKHPSGTEPRRDVDALIKRLAAQEHELRDVKARLEKLEEHAKREGAA